MLSSEVRPAEARFELTLAFHCAPALAGIKPADLIALPGEGDETDALLASYSAALAGAGISLRPLCRCRSRCLVLVYRRDRLERQLEQEEVARLLERDGYPLAGGLEAMLGQTRPVMWAAWGTLIEKRPYLPGMMRRMVAITQRYDIPWVTFGKRSKAGHPHHPLYLRKDETPQPFDVQAYLDEVFPGL